MTSLPYSFDLLYDIKTVEELHAHLTGESRCATSATDDQLIQLAREHNIPLPKQFEQVEQQPPPEDSKMPGNVSKKKLYLHRRIGSCGTGHGELEMCSIEPTGEPLVIHEDGRTWSITWSELAKMADEAFLKDSADENRPEPGLQES